MENTTTSGRIDIVVFVNGGYEFLARVASKPEVPEDVWLPRVEDFVSRLILDEPQKYSLTYEVVDGQFYMHHGEWLGEIPGYAPTPEEMQEEVRRNLGGDPFDTMQRMQEETNTYDVTPETPPTDAQ